MKRPHDLDIRDAIEFLETGDDAAKRVAAWLFEEHSAASARRQARNLGCTVKYYKKVILAEKREAR
jgi:hypothetical protein